MYALLVSNFLFGIDSLKRKSFSNIDSATITLRIKGIATKYWTVHRKVYFCSFYSFHRHHAHYLIMEELWRLATWILDLMASWNWFIFVTLANTLLFCIQCFVCSTRQEQPILKLIAKFGRKENSQKEIYYCNFTYGLFENSCIWSIIFADCGNGIKKFISL